MNKILKVLVGLMLVTSLAYNQIGYVNMKHTQTSFNQSQTALSESQAELEETTSKLSALESELILTGSNVDKLTNEVNSLKKSVKKAKEVSLSRGNLEQSRSMTVQATAYTHTGNATATGVMPKVGHIAVDPSVIPLGSIVWVEGFGSLKATDTGGLINGKIIDIFMNSEQECIEFGRQKLNIKIFK